jgi:hypothetical protein
MGRASRAKVAARAARPARSRDRLGLLVTLHEHRAFLEASAASFDAGFEAEAKRLAVSLRVLLHQTPKSHALLDQLGVMERLRFTDTSEPMHPGMLGPNLGLVILRVKPGEGRYIAPLRGLPPPRIKPPIKFTPWWTSGVGEGGEGTLWSRRDFVMALANKEGGAHVDPELTDAYEHLVHANGLGFSVPTASGVDEPFAGSPVAASVRQITHELLETLDRHAAVLG